jgi:hypothetical protein
MINFSVRPGGVAANWTLCPIVPAWILEGDPVARIEHLSSSDDGTASTYFWDCTAGRFNWFYSFDETLHILEGGMTIKEPSGRSYEVTAGDTIFFPAGSSAEWTVNHYVRKVAFCRTPLPGGLVRVRSMVRGLRALFSGKKPASGLFPAA